VRRIPNVLKYAQRISSVYKEVDKAKPLCAVLQNRKSRVEPCIAHFLPFPHFPGQMLASDSDRRALANWQTCWTQKPAFAPRDRFAASHSCEHERPEKNKNDCGTVNMVSTGSRALRSDSVRLRLQRFAWMRLTRLLRRRFLGNITILRVPEASRYV